MPENPNHSHNIPAGFGGGDQGEEGVGSVAPSAPCLVEDIDSLKEIFSFLETTNAALEHDLALALNGMPRKHFGSDGDDSPEHDSIAAQLKGRRAVLGLINRSRYFKKVIIGDVIHDDTKSILDFLEKESNNGLFRRKIVHRGRIGGLCFGSTLGRTRW